ncbi:MAG: thiol:disulfide interchange protein DsbA/DsbL [Woeseiaceae bacterium]|nr:thiol:disulfide interchange protein DsbA/DsbL [Woeseiaceae bacterium]
MENLHVLLILALSALVACGPDQQANEPEAAAGMDETADAAPSGQADTADAPADAEQAATDAEAAPELVQESAAEPEETDSGEVPLMLAQADPAAASQDWQFREGEHFHRIVPTQPTVGGADKIEVAEIFWYGCNHCFNFEPHINRWADDKPANARLVRIPAMWNPLVQLHAQLYYTEQVLAENGKLTNPEGFRSAVFSEYHERGNRLTSESAIQALFERFGVSAGDFQSTWGSFEVAQKMRVAQDLTRRYGITGVPAIVVNGKYRTGGAEAGSYPKLLEVIDRTPSPRPHADVVEWLPATTGRGRGWKPLPRWCVPRSLPPSL